MVRNVKECWREKMLLNTALWQNIIQQNGLSLKTGVLQLNWDFLKKTASTDRADWWVHIIKECSGVYPPKGHLQALLSHGPTLESVTLPVRVTQLMHVVPLFQVKGTSAVDSIVNRGHDRGANWLCSVKCLVYEAKLLQAPVLDNETTVWICDLRQTMSI